MRLEIKDVIREVSLLSEQLDDKIKDLLYRLWVTYNDHNTFVATLKVNFLPMTPVGEEFSYDHPNRCNVPIKYRLEKDSVWNLVAILEYYHNEVNVLQKELETLKATFNQ